MARTDLIIQGLDVETADLKLIAKLTHARAIEQVASQVFRLRRRNHKRRITK